MGLFFFYILPTLITLFIAYKSYSDEHFSEAMEIRSYGVLAIVVATGLIPIVNILLAGTLLVFAMIHGAFDSNPIHPRKGNK